MKRYLLIVFDICACSKLHEKKKNKYDCLKKNPPPDHLRSSTVMQQILESGLISPSFTANEEIKAGIEVLFFYVR